MNEKDKYIFGYDEEVPLELLRAKYLHKGYLLKPLEFTNDKQLKNSAKLPSISEDRSYVLESENLTDEETVFKTKDLSQESNNVDYRVISQHWARLACDVMLLLSVLVIAIFAYFAFATPTTEIGGETFYGKTQGILSFVWGDNNSIVNQIKNSFDKIANSSYTVDDSQAIVSETLFISRLFILLISAIILIISVVINTIKAIVMFSNKRSNSLASVAVNNIEKVLLIYIVFAFFGSISGGQGNEEYFVGYTVGKGLTIGALIALCLIIASVVCKYILSVKSIDKNSETFKKWIRVLITGVGCLCIAFVLPFMRMYSVFMYLFSSSLYTAILSVINSFNIQSLIFPLLNLLLFMASMEVFRKTRIGFKGAFKYLLFTGNNEAINQKLLNKIDKTCEISFISMIIYSLLSVCSICILCNPSFGYGWSVNLYFHFVIIFIFATLAQIGVKFFKR